eukprot:TRINITY_DN3796_c0_g1_i1.p1 TRINITY_DN3796_c0_g1~~TRINITY_DN3796_c0_g1_i1.p1  ORF type:complete len:215 (+),score=24.11 TRINITY_DN3796_c0_g1_i1:396-1040(+)
MTGPALQLPVKTALLESTMKKGKKLAMTLSWAEARDDRDLPANAHSSRVQSLHWVPQSPHLFVTGGWDKTLQVWDTRVDHAVTSVYGPYLCGDSLVVSNDGERVITASCRDSEQIQIWSLANPSEPCETIPLPPGSAQTHFYSLALSPQNTLAAAGATDLLIADNPSPRSQLHSLLWEDAHPVFSVSFSNTGLLMAVGGSGGRVRLYERHDDGK